MTLRLLSGNLTISILSKQFKDTWSLKIKNNLTRDGNLFDLKDIDNFELVVGKSAINVIQSYGINEDGFIDAELDLSKLKKAINHDGILSIYAILTMIQHKEVVEVLAWNGTIISHVFMQDEKYRVGIGRNSDNLFIGWNYEPSITIENINLSEDLLFLELDTNVEQNIILKDKDNASYAFTYLPKLGKYVLKLNELDLSKSKEFSIKDMHSDTTFGYSESILNNEYAWGRDRALEFDYDNLGNTRITILKQYVFVSSINQESEKISLQLKVPFTALGLESWDKDKNLLELVLQENKTPIYINSIDNVLLEDNVLTMDTSIEFDELIPYGNHDMFLRVLDKEFSILKTFHIYLGLERRNLFNNDNKNVFSVIETPTKKNSPIKLRRNDGSLLENDVQKYALNILNSQLKRQTAEYVTYRETLPIEENTILYESFFGALSDNPLALFKTIYEKDIEKKYTHIWVVSDINLQNSLSDYDSENIIFVKYNSSSYLRWLAVAQNIVFNTSTAFPFAARKEQNVLQTWHGVPLKTLGHDMAQARGLNRNVIRSMAQATIFTNPNLYTETKVLDTLDFANIQTGRRMIVSYPRQQRILKAKDEGFKGYLSTIMPINPNKKIVLYAPTWRGANGNYKNVVKEYSEAMNLINRYLPDNYQLIFKPHKMAAGFFKNNSSIIIVPDWVDVNEVLSVTDLLISDYSSIIFDFYFTGRPVINWMYDKDEYAKNNGFYSDIFTELVWPTNNERKLAWMLRNLEKYPAPKKPFIEVAEHDIEKISNAWLENYTSKEISEKEIKEVNLYIVYSSEVHRDKLGMARIINSLVNHESNKVIALLHVGDYTKSDDDFFNSLSKEVRHFYRAGQPGITVSEYIVMQKIKYGKHLTNEDYIAVQNFAKRELQREIGNINVVQVKPLGLVKDGDWATKALISLEK